MIRLSRHPRHQPSALLFVGGLLLFLLGAVGLLGLDAEPAPAALGDPLEPPAPNVILITTDDQPAATVTPEAMPNVTGLLRPNGSTFSNYVVTTPLCCPSRATTITGQYGHNNGVLQNEYGLLRHKTNVLPVWLQAAGYQTAHVGKFLNGYADFTGSDEEVAPGWDLWFTQFEKKSYYNWKASKNGKSKFYGLEDSDHLTDVTSDRAVNWTRKLVRDPEPFYMQLDYYAPHGASGRDDRCRAGPIPAPRDEGLFDAGILPEPPSFNEANVSDKPGFIQAKSQFDAETEGQIRRRYRCTLESLRGVDRGIGKIYSQIERAGELDRTIFIFTSDNGYFFGEHRIDRGKAFPYEENLRMPLTMVVPAEYRGDGELVNEVDELTANLDLAPTILELAGVDPCKSPANCRTLDGRSLLPLIGGEGSRPAEREILIEIGECNYRGLRTDRQIFLQYFTVAQETNGCVPAEAEHYDLEDDPYQLENLYPAPDPSPDADSQAELSGRIEDLRACAGIAGRDLPPESGAYCG